MWALLEEDSDSGFRHRAEFVWVVFLCTGIGTKQIVEESNRLLSPRYATVELEVFGFSTT